MSSISVIASCVFAASQSSFKQISTKNQKTAAAMTHNPSLAVVQNCMHFDMLAIRKTTTDPVERSVLIVATVKHSYS